MNDMCIFTMANDFYADACKVMLFSFLLNNKNYNGKIIVFCDDVILTLSEENQNDIRNISENISIVKVNFYEYESVFNNSLKFVENRLLPTYYKFEMFKPCYDFNKKLWIDSDIVILGNILELFDNTDYSICEDELHNGYHNSGVFYYTKDSLTLNNPFEFLITVTKGIEKIEFFKKRCSGAGRLGDQDILYEFCDTMFKRVNILDDKIYNFSQHEAEEQGINNAKILHYLGPPKPFNWQFDSNLISHRVWNEYFLLYNNFKRIYKNAN